MRLRWQRAVTVESSGSLSSSSPSLTFRRSAGLPSELINRLRWSAVETLSDRRQVYLVSIGEEEMRQLRREKRHAEILEDLMAHRGLDGGGKMTPIAQRAPQHIRNRDLHTLPFSTFFI